MACALAPGLCVSLDVPIYPISSAVDASLTGGGICEAHLDYPLLEAEVARSDARASRVALTATRQALALKPRDAGSDEERRRLHGAIDAEGLAGDQPDEVTADPANEVKTKGCGS